MQTLEEFIEFLNEPDCAEGVEDNFSKLPVVFNTRNGEYKTVLSTYITKTTSGFELTVDIE